MPYLVTGADGFIGSHLVERLLSDGYRVRALVQYTSAGSVGWLDELPAAFHQGLEVVFGDVRDSGFVHSLVKGTDGIFHLAAVVSIPHSYEQPQTHLDTNIYGTFNMLEAVRLLGVPWLVTTSTSEVYGSAQFTPMDLSHPIHPQSPYAASKAAADHVAQAYALSYGLPVRILRPFNTYGPRQSPRAVISRILGELLAGCQILRLGNTSPTRDFTFVTDTVDAFIRLGFSDTEPGTIVQCGSGASISILEVAELCMEVVGLSRPIATDENFVRPSASEVDCLIASYESARDKLDWKPSVDLRQGLGKTAEWILQRRSGTVLPASFC